MRTRKGFTIVELVIVIAVIAVLAAVLIPSFSGVVEKADKNTALKLAESAYKEARAQAIDEYNKNPHDANYQLPRAVEVNGLTFVITADGTDDEIYNYGTFEYQIFINNKKLTIGEKLPGIDNPTDDYQNTTVAESVSLFRNELTLAVGQSEMLFAAVTPAYAAGYTIEWSSASDKVSVNNGMIKGESVTDTSVTVTATLIVNGETKNTAECKVTVVPVAVNYVTLDSLNIEVELGKTHPLTATVKPADAVYGEVVWKSEDPNVATVEVDEIDELQAIVKPVDFGNTVVSVKIGEKTASCGVTVNGIKLLNNPDTMTVGSKHVMAYETFPAGMSVTWTSDDTDVATVDEAGVVTALQESAEPVTITATTSGGHHAEYRIDSINTPQVTEVIGVELKKGENPAKELLVPKDKRLEIVPTNIPSGATVDWESSDTNVATVSGGIVSPVSAGTTVVTAKITIGVEDFTASCEVTVPYTVTKDATNATIEGDDTVIPNSIYEATVIPDDGYSIDGVTVFKGETDITDSCYNEETRTIKIDSVDGDIVITVTTELIDRSRGITLSPETATIGKNGSVTLVPTVTGESLQNKTIKWSSSDPDVATVTEGTVNAVGTGTTIITASIDDGETFRATCEITVVESVVPVESITFQTPTWETTMGQSLTLVATINPDNATNKTVSWESSDESVATVDDTGTVMAHSAGTATITATVVGVPPATCVVIVAERYKIEIYNHATELCDYNGAEIENGEAIEYISPGDTYTASVTPKEGYKPVIDINMGNVDITDSAYDSITHEITIPEVDGNIVIHVTAVKN